MLTSGPALQIIRQQPSGVQAFRDHDRRYNPRSQQAVVPMLLALVDEEPAGEAPDLPPVDEEMERELMGREEVEPPVAIEVPAPDEPTSEERRQHGLTHLLYQPWCIVCVRARGREKQTCVTITKTSQAHPSSSATAAS